MAAPAAGRLAPLRQQAVGLAPAASRHGGRRRLIMAGTANAPGGSVQPALYMACGTLRRARRPHLGLPETILREPPINRHARAGGHPEAFEFPGIGATWSRGPALRGCDRGTDHGRVYTDPFARLGGQIPEGALFRPPTRPAYAGTTRAGFLRPALSIMPAGRSRPLSALPGAINRLGRSYDKCMVETPRRGRREFRR